MRTRKLLRDYADNMEEPIFVGSEISIGQAAYSMADLKFRNKMSNGAVNEVCRMMSDVLLPEPNMFPSSIHLVRGILQCAEAAIYEHHLCPKCNNVFPDLQKTAWKAEALQECVTCGHPRCSSHVVLYLSAHGAL